MPAPAIDGDRLPRLGLTAARGLLVYALLLVVIRLLGKRAVGNFTAFDVLVALMLGEVAVRNGQFLAAGSNRLNGVSDLAAERYEAAKRLCRSEDVASLRPVRARLGEVDHVEARDVSRDGDEARAEVKVRTASGESTLRLTLMWDGSEWKVTGRSREENRS